MMFSSTLLRSSCLLLFLLLFWLFPRPVPPLHLLLLLLLLLAICAGCAVVFEVERISAAQSLRRRTSRVLRGETLSPRRPHALVFWQLLFPLVSHERPLAPARVAPLPSPGSSRRPPPRAFALLASSSRPPRRRTSSRSRWVLLRRRRRRHRGRSPRSLSTSRRTSASRDAAGVDVLDDERSQLVLEERVAVVANET